MRHLFIACLLMCCASLASAQSTSFSSLEERMSAKDFKDAGLDKLTDAELAALNAWVSRSVRLADPAAAATQNSSSSSASSSSDNSAVTPESRAGFENARREEVSSRITGSFNGWSGNTQFVLDNGMVWEQAENDRADAKEIDNPGVTISPGAFNSWRLRVDGSNRTTLVKRVR